MKKILLLNCALLLLFFAQAQTTGDYRSAASGNWNDAATWQRFDGVNFVAAPAAPSNADGLITIRSGHTVTVNTGVTTDQTVVAAGGILTQTSTLTVANGTGDDITVNGSYNFVSGTLNGAGFVNVTGGMEWQSGSMQTHVTLAPSATSSKTAGNSFIDGANGVLTNNGACTWILGDFIINNGGVFNNGGTIDATGENQMFTQGGAHTFSNTGTFTKSAGTGTTVISVDGSSSGSFVVNAGTISSGRNFVNSGNITVASGKTFLVNGGNFSLNTGSNSNGAGNFQIAAGTVTVNALVGAPATATKVLFSGGTMNGAGFVNVTGGMEWQNGIMQTHVTLTPSATSSKTAGNSFIDGGNGVLTNNGAFTWILGDFIINNGGVFNNGGTINATGDNQMFNQGGAHTFTNTGTFTKSGGIVTTVINVDGSSSGSFVVNAGTISSGRNFVNSGNITVASGKTFLVNGGIFSLNTGSNSTGAGNFQVGAGIVTVNALAASPATASKVLFSGGTMNGAGFVNVTGGMEWQSGSMQTHVTLAPSATSSKTAGNSFIDGANGVLTNNGAFTWILGDFIINNGGVFNNGGTIDATGDNQMYTQSGAHTFINTGTFTKSAGTGTTVLSVDGSSSGSFVVNAGTISSGRNFVNSGNITVTSGKTFLVNGGIFSLNTGSNSTGAGNFQVGAGIVTVNALAASPATASKVLFSGGTMNGAGFVNVTGGMEWQSGSMQTHVTLAPSATSSKTAGNSFIDGANGVLTNNGAFTWILGDFIINNGGVFNNGGTIDATGDNQMFTQGGAHTFSNTGTFTKSAGTGTTVISVDGSSSGSFVVNAGTISSSRNFVNSGNITVTSGKTFLVNGGIFSLNTGSNSTGAGNFQVGAGIVTVNALAASPATASKVLFSGGTMNGAGFVNVTGGMEWQSGGMQTHVTLAPGATSSKTAGNSFIDGANGVLTNNGAFTWILGDFIINNGGVFNNGGTIDATGDNQMFTQGGAHTFSNTGTFTKSAGTGTTTIAVATTNSGTLKGIGTFNFTSSFTNNGIIAPGTSPGFLTINGAQPLSANSTLNIELLNGSGAGTGHDQLSRDGSITLAGILNVTETGTVPAGVYTIVNCTSGTISGSFATINLPPCYTLQVTSTTVQLTKVQPPVPTVSVVGATTFCQGGSVTLTSSSATGNTWSNGATTQSINVNTSGSYSVTFTNASGCTSPASAATTVTVNPLPAKPTITAGGATTFCQGGSVVLTSTASTAYLWSTGATTQSITVSTSGSYTVNRINASGCSTTSNATVVTVNALPATPTVTAGGATTFCAGGSVLLTSSAATTYLWSTGATTQSITVSTSGSYTVTITNANGCSSVASLATTVTVNPLPATPTITASASTTNVCPGQTVTLTSSASSSYVWSTGAVTQSIIVNAAGNYSVAVTNVNGCQSAGSTPVVVTYQSCPKPTSPVVSNITATAARLSWTPPASCAIGYQLQYRKVSTATWTTAQFTASNKNITGLTAGTVYEWRVQAGCQQSPPIGSGYINGPNFTTATAFAFTGYSSKESLTAGGLQALVYPNPSKSIATLKVSGDVNGIVITLTDIAGKVLWKQSNIKTNLVQLPVAQLTAGIYLVNLSNGKESTVVKFIKE